MLKYFPAGSAHPEAVLIVRNETEAQTSGWKSTSSAPFTSNFATRPGSSKDVHLLGKSDTTLITIFRLQLPLTAVIHQYPLHLYRQLQVLLESGTSTSSFGEISTRLADRSPQFVHCTKALQIVSFTASIESTFSTSAFKYRPSIGIVFD